MGAWLAEHGLELALALVSGAWFVSRMLVNFGAWKRGLDTPAAATLTEERLQMELRALTHTTRDLIIKDLTALVQKVERRMEDGNGKSSEMWGKVQTKIGDLEVRIVRIETRQEDRP